MHCGMCLPTCPTYALTPIERSSPRGRIRLIKYFAEGRMELNNDFAAEMFYCLNCRACETACPAGVQYAPLVEAARAAVQQSALVTRREKFLNELFLRRIFPHRSRLYLLARMLRLIQSLHLDRLGERTGLLRLMAPGLAKLAPLAPPVQKKFTEQLIPETTPARGTRRWRVGLMSGCVMSTHFSHVNADTVRVLAENGCEVIVPRQQECCGSLHAHTGDLRTARRLARLMIDAAEQARVDFWINNAAGCGSHLKTYDHLLADDPAYADRAGAFVEKVRDVTEFLVEIGFRRPQRPLNLTVTFDDPCHLLHGQHIKNPPRIILDSIPGLRHVPLTESDWCCGSAGIYNLTHFDAAVQILDRKMKHVAATGADVLVTANPGCMVQLDYGIRRHGLSMKVLHVITLLRMAYESS
ncbi:MAG: heterodisulfide reductase-related iron-sulfur binding cluster [Candidatus Sumerlaeia bacterium]